MLFYLCLFLILWSCENNNSQLKALPNTVNQRQDTLFNAPFCAFDYGLLSNQSTSFIFHSNADIYIDKLCHKKYKGKFPIGSKVYIIDTLTSTNGKNISRIYHCKLKTDSIPLTCYIPLKDLAIACHYTKGKSLILVGFANLNKSIEEFEVKLIKDKTSISKRKFQVRQTEFHIYDDFSYCLNFKEVKALKHSEISSFYNLNFYYPACGFTAYDFYLFLSNDEKNITISKHFPSIYEAGIYNYSGNLTSKKDQFLYTSIAEEILEYNTDSNFVKSDISEVTIKYKYSKVKGLVYCDTLSTKNYLKISGIE